MSFSVYIEPSGHRIQVEKGETILDAALRQGITLPYGCRSAVCGTCKGKVLEGRLDYGEVEPVGLSEDDKACGMALFCQARPRSEMRIEINEINSPQHIEIRKLPVRVIGLERLAPDVMRLFLKLPATERLQFLAGQYIDILLRDGRRRSFSIANPPQHDEFIELHIRHIEGGVFTDHVFKRMKERDILRIEGPFGNYYLREDSPRPILMMAGGTGFAPLKGIIEHALAEGVARPMHLYWGVRALRDLYLGELARNWCQHANFHFIPVLSSPGLENRWTGRRGLVHEAVLEDIPDLGGYDVYASGPPQMITAARDAFFKRGLPEKHFYFDSFDLAQDPATQGEQAG